MPKPTMTPTGEVISSETYTYKVRTEEIVIRNQDPANKRVDVYESVRAVSPSGKMGAPLRNQVRSFTVEELAAVEIDGITLLQAMTFIAKWAASVNLADGEQMMAGLLPSDD